MICVIYIYYIDIKACELHSCTEKLRHLQFTGCINGFYWWYILEYFSHSVHNVNSIITLLHLLHWFFISSRRKKAFSHPLSMFWNSAFENLWGVFLPCGVPGTSLSNNTSRQFSATSVEVLYQTGRSSSTTTASLPALLLLHLDHCNAQTGCRGQICPTCPPWGRGGRLCRAPREPGQGWRREMMNDLLKKQPYLSTVCLFGTLSDGNAVKYG